MQLSAMEQWSKYDKGVWCVWSRNVVSAVDLLLVSKWQRLEDITNLLQPFAEQTDVLQTDSVSLSNILPSILNLECHLQQRQQHSIHKQLAASMLHDLRSRFQTTLQPDSEHFNPLPAAASLLDPLLAPILLAQDYQGLLSAAQLYIVSLASEATAAPTSVTSQTDSQPPSTATPAGLHCSAFLTAKIDASRSVPSTSGSSNKDSIATELNKYLTTIDPTESPTNALYWSQHHLFYNKLVQVQVQVQ